MPRKPNYWIDSPPPSATRWQGAEHGVGLDMDEFQEPLFRLYRRYAKQWNDIELDNSRSLAEHTHRVCGAQVVGSSGKFILTANPSREAGWILEVIFARGFRQYYPGLSCGLNAPRSAADVKRAILHWRGTGREDFAAWLVRERLENGAKGEWTEYKK